eukprot:m.97848 g.97848  ORF g.97848 m.97848 type:complete len:441 (-) comp16729_c0_seq1:325-1647(-)
MGSIFSSGKRQKSSESASSATMSATMSEEQQKKLEADLALIGKKNVIFVVGGPGSGKGTQCAKIAEKYAMEHFSVGDLLRAEAASGSERGNKIAELQAKGELVPDSWTVEVLKNAIESAPAGKGILLDGFPRAEQQMTLLDEKISPSVKSKMMLWMECSREVMKQRLLSRGKTSGRSDDNEAAIENRFDTFVQKTKPVVDAFKYFGHVHRIDADKEIDDVFTSTCAAVEKLEQSVPVAQRRKVVFVVGGPGSGKGTQCSKISSKYDMLHLSVGDLLRTEAQSGTERGKQIAAIQAEGKLVPDDITVDVINKAIDAAPDGQGVLLDGFPRAQEQMTLFNDKVGASVKKKLMLWMECSHETMKTRLLARGQTSGRSDDNEESIKQRFDTFMEKTKPVVEHFADFGHVHHIDANDDVDAVFDNACEALAQNLWTRPPSPANEE